MNTSSWVKTLELLLAPVLLPSGSHLSMSSQEWKAGGQMGMGGLQQALGSCTQPPPLCLPWVHAKRAWLERNVLAWEKQMFEKEKERVEQQRKS